MTDRPLHANCVFSEDIRQEIAGTSTIVGVLSSTVEVLDFPVTLPKLAVYVRVFVPSHIVADSISVEIRSNANPEPLMVANIPSEQISAIYSKELRPDSLGISMDFRIVANMMNIEKSCRWECFAIVNGVGVWAGSVYFAKSSLPQQK